MKYIAVYLDEGLVSRARRYAAENETSLEDLISDLLERKFEPRSRAWLEDMFAPADQNDWHSTEQWTREGAYDAKKVL